MIAYVRPGEGLEKPSQAQSGERVICFMGTLVYTSRMAIAGTCPRVFRFALASLRGYGPCRFGDAGLLLQGALRMGGISPRRQRADVVAADRRQSGPRRGSESSAAVLEAGASGGGGRDRANGRVRFRVPTSGGWKSVLRGCSVEALGAAVRVEVDAEEAERGGAGDRARRA